MIRKLKLESRGYKKESNKSSLIAELKKEAKAYLATDSDVMDAGDLYDIGEFNSYESRGLTEEEILDVLRDVFSVWEKRNNKDKKIYNYIKKQLKMKITPDLIEDDIQGMFNIDRQAAYLMVDNVIKRRE